MTISDFHTRNFENLFPKGYLPYNRLEFDGPCLVKCREVSSDLTKQSRQTSFRLRLCYKQWYSDYWYQVSDTYKDSRHASSFLLILTAFGWQFPKEQNGIHVLKYVRDIMPVWMTISEGTERYSRSEICSWYNASCRPHNGKIHRLSPQLSCSKSNSIS